MIKHKIFGKWAKINGNGTIPEVRELVWNFLIKNKFI
jgi:hypothetical protein